MRKLVFGIEWFQIKKVYLPYSLYALLIPDTDDGTCISFATQVQTSDSKISQTIISDWNTK